MCHLLFPPAWRTAQHWRLLFPSIHYESITVENSSQQIRLQKLLTWHYQHHGSFLSRSPCISAWDSHISAGRKLLEQANSSPQQQQNKFHGASTKPYCQFLPYSSSNGTFIHFPLLVQTPQPFCCFILRPFSIPPVCWDKWLLPFTNPCERKERYSVLLFRKPILNSFNLLWQHDFFPNISSFVIAQVPPFTDVHFTISCAVQNECNAPISHG